MLVGVRLQTESDATGKDRIGIPMGRHQHRCKGPFVAWRKGERYILSVIDCFSRYLILIPIKDHNATTVSLALFERVIGYFGCPLKILSDRGAKFTGRMWSEMMELMGI